MTKFVEVTVKGRLVFLNSDHVKAVEPDTPTAGETSLTFDDGQVKVINSDASAFIGEANRIA